jgi:hypothetical protein
MGTCEDKCTHMTEEYWKPMCKKLIRIERESMEAGRIVDDTTPKFVIPFARDSDSGSGSGSDESNSS